ncbi:MAG: glutamate-5-semialdehyde dehydrogenase [Oscillospiraceae bacterium]|jgi:glutamate-5-semialdehyde dehydrogenase|nr:glutamate-5-semialdehyde dehydrogenase [Oscillospiraceae bacterium]
MAELEQMGAAAKAAGRSLAVAGTMKKNRALEAIRTALLTNRDRILEANARDIRNAETVGVKRAFLDRLLLTAGRIDDMARGVSELVALPDPVGEVLSMADRPNGLTIGQKRVPLGVIGLIYEARPNVTVDAAALCLKAGNACILRGGKEAVNSNATMVDIMREALAVSGLPEDCVCLVRDSSRESARALMGLRGYVDVLIPRGGSGLIKSVVENAGVPVIETGSGNCHIYVDDAANLEMAARIVENAKCSRPSVCNAMETLLVHEAVAEPYLTLVQPRLGQHGVELRCDEKALKILGKSAIPATESDWETEYDDYILAIKTVASLDEALAHIARYSTGHSEAIITGDYSKAQRFLSEVDAAAVYVNASTRFTDGGEFGLGAEIGISTQKMHARGPMGLRELTSTKYVIYGNGQIR